ncbi:MAG: carbonic anhydrase [Thermoleophilaceae bacterium]|jgi:carbonic anhydrase|nr:carbonic anhydrase [Thermoleophilaceae bacterium]
MGSIDDLLKNAERYAEDFPHGDLRRPPVRKLAVVACMDSRLNPNNLLGLREGDAHIIRNAGGIIAEDEIRSLAISQHLMGTEAIILLHHTDCGMLTFDDEEFATKLEAEAGQRPTWEGQAFTDLEEDMRESLSRVRTSPFIPHRDQVRGFIYEVETGVLREVA